MNGYRFKYVTGAMIKELWPNNYNSALKRIANPVQQNNPIVDKMLSSYEAGEYAKAATFGLIIERMSLPVVACPADVNIRTSESLHTAQMGTKTGVGGKLEDR